MKRNKPPRLMNANILFWILLMSLPCAGQILRDDSPQKTTAEAPEPVQRLLAWPSSEVVLQKRTSTVATNVQPAVYGAEAWLRKVLDGEMLPAKLDVLCIADEFEGRDVIRIKWTNSNRVFMVAQTGSIFVMEVKPESGMLSDGQNKSRLDVVKGLALDVFAKSGKRWSGQGEEVLIPQLNRKIISASFDARRVKQITRQDSTSILIGKPSTMLEDNVVQPQNNDEIKVQDDKSNPEWENSAFAWNYWFRNVHWFADETRLIVYFLKEEGGPVKLSFGGAADSSWFK